MDKKIKERRLRDLRCKRARRVLAYMAHKKVYGTINAVDYVWNVYRDCRGVPACDLRVHTKARYG